MDFGRSLLSAGVAVASWLATPSVSVSRPLAPSPTEADRSLPGDLLWSLDAFAPAPLDSAIPASASVLSPLAATSPALVRGAAGASRALSVSPSSSFSSSLSSRCASPAPDSLASPAPRPEDIGFRPTAFRRPRTVSAYQLAVQGYTGPLRREAKTPLRLRQRFNGNWGSMWPRPATPNGSWQGDSATLDGLNLPRPAAQPRRAHKAAPAPRQRATVNANKENLARTSTTPIASPPPRRTAAPLCVRNGNAVRTLGRFNARFTDEDTEVTMMPGACTPRAARATPGKAVQPRVRMAPPPALPLAPLGPASTTPTGTPTVRAPLLSAMHSSSPSAPLALSSTPVRSAPYNKRRMSPPPSLASLPRAGPSTPTRAATAMTSTPPRPRLDKGKAPAVSPPPSLPSQDFAVGDETVMANGDNNDDDDTVRTEDVELSTEVLAGLGMEKFPGLTLVQPRAGHTTGRLCLPSFGLPACVVTRKAAPKAAKAKTPRTVTILSPPVSSAPAASRAPATPGPAARDLGKSIRAGASVRARATAMEELAAVSATTTTAPAPISGPSAPGSAVRTPSSSRVSSATAPAKTISKASQQIAAGLEEIDRETKARFGGAPPPGCLPATRTTAVPAFRDPQAIQAEWERHLAEDLSTSSIGSVDSARSSRKRPATEYDWMHADVAPLNGSLAQALKKQRPSSALPASRRQGALGLGPRPSGLPIRLDAPRRRAAVVPLRGASAAGPRLPPIPRPITVVKVNGVVVMDLTIGSPAPACASFVNTPTASPPPTPVAASSTPAAAEASLSADSTFASSSGGSRLALAARSFSLEAADRSRKVKDAARRRMAEMRLAVDQRRQRQDKERPQAQEAEQQQPQRQPTTPKQKTSSSRPRLPLRSCRSQVESAARRHRLCRQPAANGASSNAATIHLAEIVVTSPSSPSAVTSPPPATSSAFLAVPEHTVAHNAPAQLVEPLEADYSNDDSVVRAIWSATNGLGPGFQDESLEDPFVVKCRVCDPTWFRRDADGDVMMKDVADCTC